MLLCALESNTGLNVRKCRETFQMLNLLVSQAAQILSYTAGYIVSDLHIKACMFLE